MSEEPWDAIVAGCGLAGLSFAYELSCERKDIFRILLLDREKRRERDHTWCFWEKGDGDWDSQLSWEWFEIQVGLGGKLKQYPLDEYRYKYLESNFFYQQVWSQLEQDARFEFREADIKSVEKEGARGIVTTEQGQRFVANQVFSSIHEPNTKIGLWQHFLGWEVHTTKPVFDPTVATLMDFQPDEDGEVRFVYVLPVSEQEALVEYTVFGPEIWSEEVYHEKLSSFLREDLEVGSWMVKHEEIGAIPMSGSLGKSSTQPIRYIGTAGGLVKPSTGYAFSRIQRDSRKIAAEWKIGSAPPKPAKQSLYHACDTTLVNLMEAGEFSVSAYFDSLFERWGGDKMLGFLDEQLPVPEVLEIMTKTKVQSLNI